MAIKSFAFAEDWQMLEPLRHRGGIPAVKSVDSVPWPVLVRVFS